MAAGAGREATVSAAVGATAARLEAAGVEGARTEAELLVGAACRRERTWLFLHPDVRLTPDEARELAEITARRERREPLPYVLGRAEFYGLSLRLTPAAICPRPETEVLVEQAAARALGAEVALDVGTGSGAIAVALAKELPRLRVAALDIAPEALRLAQENCQAHGVAGRVGVVCSDLLAAVRGPVDCIVANMPYIRTEEFAGLEPEVTVFEPRRALDGGHDGLVVVERLCAQLEGRLRPGGFAALEVGAGQADAVGRLLRAGGLSGVETVRDYAGIERVVIGRRSGRGRRC